MRKILLCCLVMLCAGCQPYARMREPSPSPAPTSTPEPAPVLALLGGTENEGFIDIVRSIAKSAACDYAQPRESGSFRPAGRAVLIWYLEDDAPDAAALAALKERGVFVYAFAARGQTLPEGLQGLVYDGADAAGLALGEAANYENHDTPVRLLGLFTETDSRAIAAWDAAVKEGRILDRGVYRETDDEKSAADWLSGRLTRWPVGMLDGIFCENAALARESAEVLTKRTRDELEIFCAAADGALLTLMQQRPWPIVCAAGAAPQEAGRLCAEQALVLLYGGTAQTLHIRPSVFAAS